MRNPKQTIFVLVAISVIVACEVIGAESGTMLQETDVFAGGTDGYHSYRIPALIVSSNGTLLAICEGRRNSRADSGDIDLVLKRSTDNGRTWSKQQVVWDDGLNTCGNPCPVLDEATGAIWLLMTHNDGRDRESAIKAKKGFGTRTVWVSRSGDNGTTWSKPEEITKTVKDPPWGWYATGPGVGIQIKHGSLRGRLVIPCDHTYDDAGGNVRGLPVEYGSHVIFSDDHGKTWKLGGTIRPKVNECQVAELADDKGTLLLDMRAYFGRSRRAQSISRDGGLTWSPPEDNRELIEPVCQASILRYTWPVQNGRSRILFSNPADEKKRSNMTVRLSYDEGKTWPVGRTLYAEDSAYSCLSVLPDGQIACLYERGKESAYEKIAFAQFSLGWLTRGQDSSSLK
jgi:sialidase-1